MLLAARAGAHHLCASAQAIQFCGCIPYAPRPSPAGSARWRPVHHQRGLPSVRSGESVTHAGVRIEVHRTDCIPAKLNCAPLDHLRSHDLARGEQHAAQRRKLLLIERTTAGTGPGQGGAESDVVRLHVLQQKHMPPLQIARHSKSQRVDPAAMVETRRSQVSHTIVTYSALFRSERPAL